MTTHQDCPDCLMAALGNPGAWHCYRANCTACGERMLEMLKEQAVSRLEELQPLDNFPRPPHKDKYL